MFFCEYCKIFKKTYFEEVLESVIDKTFVDDPVLPSYSMKMKLPWTLHQLL